MITDSVSLVKRHNGLGDSSRSLQKVPLQIRPPSHATPRQWPDTTTTPAIAIKEQQNRIRTHRRMGSHLTENSAVSAAAPTCTSSGFSSSLLAQPAGNTAHSSLFRTPPSIDDMMAACVEQLWAQYDTKGVGYLDRLQSKMFVEDALFGKRSTLDEELDDGFEDGACGDFKQSDSELDNQGILTLEEFDSIFAKIDTDGNGTLSKDEIRVFIKMIIGL